MLSQIPVVININYLKTSLRLFHFRNTCAFVNKDELHSEY